MAYDVAIVGGGFAGLSQAILLRSKGCSVILFEKETYPFQKVCGEFISMHSWNYLEQLGLQLSSLNVPVINELAISSPSGRILKKAFRPGGFGLSRYTSDHLLKNIALRNGVIIKEKTKVEKITFNQHGFEIICNGNEEYQSKVCVAAWGKKSNLDVKLNRSFGSGGRGKEFIAIKYHVKYNHPDNLISLHNFKNGYCGISKVEDDKSCLCYLTHSSNLKKSGSIELMEKNILSANPHLKQIFENATKLTPKVSVSQLIFEKKSSVENHILMTGDTAGMITPLCGNGMTMALHSGKIASELILKFLNKEIDRNKLESSYSELWANHFSARLRTGRIVQKFFGASWKTNLFIELMNKVPPLASVIISKTQGKPF